MGNETSQELVFDPILPYEFSSIEVGYTHDEITIASDERTIDLIKMLAKQYESFF